ncbi:MAG: acylneuraminate cytidylyltransferase [Verrucomicrobia bacterium]|nr:acylneuraminate cytidylyltransferase [Verrucomicrobiota bacterium]
MNTIAFIPLRGGSKSIPGKNLKPLAGKPLFHWVTEAALAVEAIDQVVIATDDPAIKATALAIGHPKLSVYDRKPENAGDTASTESVMLEYAEAHDFETMILIQATSPLLTSEDLSAGLEKRHETEADSLLSVVEQKRFLWTADEHGYGHAVNYKPGKRPRRQEFQGHLVENGAFYICSKQGLLETQCRLHGKIALQQMPEESYIELDEPHDWLFIETLLKSRNPSKFDVQSLPARRSSESEGGFEVRFPNISKIKMLLTDVDGVLTDAGMYYSENGDELKKFNTRDAVGLRLLREAGLKVGILTSENTRIVERRAQKIGVDILIQGAKDKAEELEKLLKAHNLTADQVAFIGDDINDLGILKMVGFAATPADGQPAVKNFVHHICQAKGGEGAVRELAEMILEESGKVEKYEGGKV